MLLLSVRMGNGKNEAQNEAIVRLCFASNFRNCPDVSDGSERYVSRWGLGAVLNERALVAPGPADCEADDWSMEVGPS